MPELDLRPIERLPKKVRRSEVARLYVLNEQLRERLEQQNDLAAINSRMRRIARIGLKARDLDDPALLKEAIGMILEVARPRLAT